MPGVEAAPVQHWLSPGIRRTPRQRSRVTVQLPAGLPLRWRANVAGAASQVSIMATWFAAGTLFTAPVYHAFTAPRHYARNWMTHRSGSHCLS